MKRVVPVALVLLAVAHPASAQLCTGNPSFRDGPYQVGIGAAFREGARAVGGSFAGGGESLFGGAGLSVTNFTNLDVRATGVEAFVGAELAADSRNRVLVCPVASLAFIAGPDVGPVDVSTARLLAGGNVGVIASDSGDAMIVPFFGLSLVYSRVTTQFAGSETSFSDTGALADLGVGLIFDRTVGITPLVSIPFSTGNSDVIFTIRFSFNFGR